MSLEEFRMHYSTTLLLPTTLIRQQTVSFIRYVSYLVDVPQTVFLPVFPTLGAWASLLKVSLDSKKNSDDEVGANIFCLITSSGVREDSCQWTSKLIQYVVSTPKSWYYLLLISVIRQLRFFDTRVPGFQVSRT